MVYDFLEQHNMIYKLQFGFHQKHSTNHALDITENIRKALANGEYMHAVFSSASKKHLTLSITLYSSANYIIMGSEE